MEIDNLQLLRLLHLADSALPIGTTAHSFGLETLTAEGELTVEQLESFLHDYLIEAGSQECAYTRLAYRSAGQADEEIFLQEWLELNARLSATKIARESRLASATLGRRLLQLIISLENHARFELALKAARSQKREIHYSLVFGLIAQILHYPETIAILAYLQQTVAGLVSASQRLLPLGQSQASSILWRIKPTLLEIVQISAELAEEPAYISICTPGIEIASMRHPTLSTRLFIS